MKRLLTLSILGAFVLPAAVAAPDGAALYTQLSRQAAVAASDGAALYAEKTCIACHGPKGNKPLLPSYPRIAGQNAAYAEQQMKDIKSGARANGQAAAMAGIMHLVNDEEIKALAIWLETLK